MFAAYALLLAGVSPALADYSLNTLVQFNGANGSYPDWGLSADSHGNFFGTTGGGGAYNNGTLFELSPSTGGYQFRTLASFDGSNGARPSGNVIVDSAGNLYGTTATGATNMVNGTIFEYSASTGTLHTVATFDGSNTGAGPGLRMVADGGGNLFGVTGGGGPYQNGTVFKFSTSTHALSAIASFDSSYTHTGGSGLAIDSAGNLYGTSSGVTYPWNRSTIFEIPVGSNSIKTLATFTDARWLSPVITDPSGNVYGCSGAASDSDSFIYKIDPATGQMKTLASFAGTGSDGTTFGGLLIGADGNFYGTANAGTAGQHGEGTVFEFNSATNAITTLGTFDSFNGFYPEDGLVQDASGSLYGTTLQGGQIAPYVISEDGTVFELTVPEPSALCLMGVIASGMLLSRRRSR